MFNLLQTQKYFEIKGNASGFSKIKKKQQQNTKTPTKLRQTLGYEKNIVTIQKSKTCWCHLKCQYLNYHFD